MSRPYQVLARKWRPQRFDDVIGQVGVTQTLRNALERQRIAQAFGAAAAGPQARRGRRCGDRDRPAPGGEPFVGLRAVGL